MDDVNAFDRQLASVVLRRVGPSEPVDDAAIFTAITATRSPKWRFQPMFSATKSVVAGALVFAIGGVLLLAQPFADQQDDTPAAEGAKPFPVVVEGRIPFGIETSGPTVNSFPDADLIEHRGQTLEGPIVEMSDARLEGTVTIEGNEDHYRGSGSTPTVVIYTYVLRIENDEGAWQGHPVVGATLSATSTTTNTIVLEGEGAYEGLTAVLELAQQPREFTVAGVIFGGDPPPNPAATTAGQ